MILGIDPGTYICGYGIIDNDELITHGYIKIPKGWKMPRKLTHLWTNFDTLIKTYPTLNIIAIEDQFYSKSVNTVKALSYIKGLLMVLSELYQKQYMELTPTNIKLNVGGHGHTPKDDIQKIIEDKYNIKCEEQDVSDAIAIAMAAEVERNKHDNNT